MIGAIIGDIVGSIYEFRNLKSKEFEFFDKKCFYTDDSVMTIAVAKALVESGKDEKGLSAAAIKHMRDLGLRHPNRGYGSGFKVWLTEEQKPYFSLGNGAAMRVSPVGFYAESEEQVKILSKAVTEISHDHPEGIKGAEATAMAVYMAKKGYYVTEIRDRMIKDYYPEISEITVDGIREEYFFDGTCQGTVPQAMQCFFESTDFEDAIRNGVSIGGDTDTICAIIGGIAEAYYGIPYYIKEKAMKYLDEDLKTELKLIRQYFL